MTHHTLNMLLSVRLVLHVYIPHYILTYISYRSFSPALFCALLVVLAQHSLWSVPPGGNYSISSIDDGLSPKQGTDDLPVIHF